MNSQSYNKYINDLIMTITYPIFCSWCIVFSHESNFAQLLEQLSLILEFLLEHSGKFNDAMYVIQISRNVFAVNLIGKSINH